MTGRAGHGHAFGRLQAGPILDEEVPGTLIEFSCELAGEPRRSPDPQLNIINVGPGILLCRFIWDAEALVGLQPREGGLDADVGKEGLAAAARRPGLAQRLRREQRPRQRLLRTELDRREQKRQVVGCTAMAALLLAGAMAAPVAGAASGNMTYFFAPL